MFFLWNSRFPCKIQCGNTTFRQYQEFFYKTLRESSHIPKKVFCQERSGNAFVLSPVYHYEGSIFLFSTPHHGKRTKYAFGVFRSFLADEIAQATQPYPTETVLLLIFAISIFGEFSDFYTDFTKKGRNSRNRRKRKRTNEVNKHRKLSFVLTYTPTHVVWDFVHWFY